MRSHIQMCLRCPVKNLLKKTKRVPDMNQDSIKLPNLPNQEKEEEEEEVKGFLLEEIAQPIRETVFISTL
jgi:hypothetical protein